MHTFLLCISILFLILILPIMSEQRFKFYVNVYQCIVLLFIVIFNTEPKLYNFHAASSLQ